MKNGVITLSTLSAFTNSLRQGNSTDDSRNYGAWGFQGAPPYLLEITIDSDCKLTGIPLPADFKVASGSLGFRIWKISLGKDYFPDASYKKYMDECTEKIREVRELIEGENLNVDVQVDGGINDETMETVMTVGANLLVAGSYVFNGDVEANVRHARAKMDEIIQKIN